MKKIKAITLVRDYYEGLNLVCLNRAEGKELAEGIWSFPSVTPFNKIFSILEMENAPNFFDIKPELKTKSISVDIEYGNKSNNTVVLSPGMIADILAQYFHDKYEFSVKEIKK